MGLLSFHLGLEQLKDRTIKSSTMSQVLCSTIILEFLQVFLKIKLRDSIVWHYQVSHIYGICGSSPRHNLLLPFFFLPLRLYVEFIGREKVWPYLQYIYCKVKQWIQRELSHTIKSRCACVWNMVDINMVASLILLCSLKTYLSFGTWKHLLESRCYLIHHSFIFSGGHLSTHCFNILDTCPFFLNSSFFFFLWITFA